WENEHANWPTAEASDLAGRGGRKTGDVGTAPQDRRAVRNHRRHSGQVAQTVFGGAFGWLVGRTACWGTPPDYGCTSRGGRHAHAGEYRGGGDPLEHAHPGPGVGLSQRAVVRIWHAFGLQPHRRENFKLSTDSFFVEKVRDIVGLYMTPPDHAIVLAMDEKSPIQALNRTQPILRCVRGCRSSKRTIMSGTER